MSDRKRIKITYKEDEPVQIFSNHKSAIEFIEELRKERSEKEYKEKHKEEIAKWERENETKFDIYDSAELEEEYEEPDDFYDYEEAKEWLEQNTNYSIEEYLKPKHVHKSDKYFYGVDISDYERENEFISYKTLASTFEGVLCNGFMEKTEEIGYWEQVNGEEDESNYEKEIFQQFIIDDNGARILKDYTDEILYYNSELDLYVWCITHYGTSWSHVLTDIPIQPE